MAIKQISKSRDGLLDQIKSELSDIAIAVEIGTWRGEYALNMINILKPVAFFAVDPYRIFPGMVSAPGSEYNNQTDLDNLANNVQQKLEEAGGKLIRELSCDASLEFANEGLDVVYVDGDHTYEGVKTDIECWWPKVRPGGILCGDDYVKSTTGKGFDYGVIEAVDEFVQQNNLDLDIYTQGQRQWLIRKPHE